MQKEFKVIAIHGEGDQDTVNRLQNHRNHMEAKRLASFNQPIPANLMLAADEQPDIIIVLRDEHHDFRMEWPVTTWDEVQKWKRLAGYDEDKRHWKHGAVVKVKIGG